MTDFLPTLAAADLGPALLIALVAGLVQGLVRFAMPLVLLSGRTLFLPPELALAGLILPTLVSNAMQSLRQGRQAAAQSIRQFRVFLIAGAVTLFISAQFVRVIPETVFLLIVGVPVVVFSVVQLLGLKMQLARRSAPVEAAVGGFAGAIGGLSGIWGPHTVMYLTALDTPKADQMRIQGVIYGLGSAALLGAHVTSGVLRGETWPFSALLVPPAVLGMWLGGRISDRIDQRTFRRATLVVLTLAGANLVRRALL